MEGGRDIPAVGANGGQQKKGAQHVLSFRNPGHGLYVHGVQSEQGRYQTAAAESAGYPRQNEKQEQCIGYMKADVGEMHGAGVNPVELRVQHEGQPGERMPVARAAGGKSPGDPRPGEAGPNHGIGSDIETVIKSGEVKVPHLEVRQQGRAGQQQA